MAVTLTLAADKLSGWVGGLWCDYLWVSLSGSPRQEEGAFAASEACARCKQSLPSLNQTPLLAHCTAYGAHFGRNLVVQPVMTAAALSMGKLWGAAGSTTSPSASKAGA